jgi:hypothetical protein
MTNKLSSRQTALPSELRAGPFRNVLHVYYGHSSHYDLVARLGALTLLLPKWYPALYDNMSHRPLSVQLMNSYEIFIKATRHGYALGLVRFLTRGILAGQSCVDGVQLDRHIHTYRRL